MSAQNNYWIAWKHKSRETEEWTVWKYSDYWWETADTWQDAIQEWIDDAWPAAEYTVVAETPSGGGKSGIIEIEFGPTIFWLGMKIKATPQRADLSAG